MESALVNCTWIPTADCIFQLEKFAESHVSCKPAINRLEPANLENKYCTCSGKNCKPTQIHTTAERKVAPSSTAPLRRRRVFGDPLFFTSKCGVVACSLRSPIDQREGHKKVCVWFTVTVTTAVALRRYVTVLDKDKELFFCVLLQVLYVVGHPGATETGDLVGDVLYVKVRVSIRAHVRAELNGYLVSCFWFLPLVLRRGLAL